MRKEEKKSSDERFIIPVEYKIVLTKREDEGDFKISLTSDAQPGVIVNVPKDHNKTHPYRSKDVIELVNRKSSQKLITHYVFQGLLLKEKVRNSPQNEYYYRIENPETHKFSQSLVDLILKRIEEVDGYIEKAKAKYKEYLNSKRKKKKDET